MSENIEVPEHIIREATYEAARFGWYDTSEEAEKQNLLTISVVNLASLEPLPENITHKFLVMIDATESMVSRYPDGHYEIAAHDRASIQRRERELRTTVLDHALWYHSQERGGYPLHVSAEQRAEAIGQLMATSPGAYPVIREYSGTWLLAEREWRVDIGPYRCSVLLVGYNADGTPKLVTVSAELH